MNLETLVSEHVLILLNIGTIAVIGVFAFVTWKIHQALEKDDLDA